MIAPPAGAAVARRRGPRVALVVGAAVAVALLSSFLLVLTPSLSDRPGLQTLWVLFSLVLLKVPLLLLVWWMIVRRRGRPGPPDGSSEAPAALVERIEEAAARAARAPDAAPRLASLRAEAWSAIGQAGEADAPALVELALRLERLERFGGRPATGVDAGPAAPPPGS